jgi:arylsulfatase A-like enzyme
LQANYAGEVTLVDRWFGYFMDALKLSGRLDDTVIAVISDHGHNLGYEPGDKGLIGKQGHPLTQSVANLVMMVRHPLGEGAGMECHGLTHDHDLSCTLLNIAGVEPTEGMDGLNFWSAVKDKALRIRDHVTIGWGSLITVINDQWWYNANIWGDGKLLYSLEDAPDLMNNVADQYPEVCDQMNNLAVQDAGGEIPEELLVFRDETPCKLFSFGTGPYPNTARLGKIL